VYEMQPIGCGIFWGMVCVRCGHVLRERTDEATQTDAYTGHRGE